MLRAVLRLKIITYHVYRISKINGLFMFKINIVTLFWLRFCTRVK